MQPPCLQGADSALEPMLLASGVKFMIKAVTNATYTHVSDSGERRNYSFRQLLMPPDRNSRLLLLFSFITPTLCCMLCVPLPMQHRIHIVRPEDDTVKRIV